MGEINKFLLEYVNKISSLSDQRTKIINSSIPKFIRNEINQSLNAIAFRDYVIRDLFEISMRQSASHFVALDKNSWNQFQDTIKLDLFSIHSNWSLEDGKDLADLSLHKRIYQNTDADAIVICHPAEIYELVLKNIDFLKTPHLPKSSIFDKFIVLQDDHFETQDKFKRLMFSYEKGLISWGKSLFEAINQIELLIFSAKVALIHTGTSKKRS
ncbi:MAG: class II aldolase/adducin family protein [Pelolinea sp.]|nr:class II aldolase/adducin family protein [Pelolinea sp.]